MCKERNILYAEDLNNFEEQTKKHESLSLRKMIVSDLGELLVFAIKIKLKKGEDLTE